MLLDTGAPSTLIDAHSAEAAGVRSTIDRIDIGDLHLEGRIRCTVREVDHLSAALGVDIDGVLGYDVFSKVLLTYDYPRQEVRARTGALTDDLPGVAPMSTSNRPFVGAMVGAEKVNVLLDTGSAHGLTLAGFDRLSFVAPPRPVGARMRLGGLHITRAGRLADDVQFGSMTLSRPVIKNAVGDSLLGQGILRDFVVTLDRRSGLVQIVHADGTAVAAPLDSSGLFGSGWVLRPGHDRAVIEEVLSGTPAAAAGLLREDVLLAVNGVAFGELGCDRHSGQNDQPAELTVLIERDGGRLEVEMTTALLVQ